MSESCTRNTTYSAQNLNEGQHHTQYEAAHEIYPTHFYSRAWRRQWRPTTTPPVASAKSVHARPVIPCGPIKTGPAQVLRMCGTERREAWQASADTPTLSSPR